MGKEFVRVFSTQSLVEGEIVKGRLEAEGIPVDLRGEREAHTLWARPSCSFHRGSMHKRAE